MVKFVIILGSHNLVGVHLVYYCEKKPELHSKLKAKIPNQAKLVKALKTIP